MTAVLSAAACLLYAGPSRAGFPRWQPADIGPTTATLPEIAALYERGSGTPDAAYAERVERYVSTSVNGTTFASVATIRNGDYALTTVAGDATYRSGRFGGRRWRETPGGVVRIVASDVQADGLDRWPLAVLGFDLAACGVAGRTRAGGAFVLECDPPGDVPHWLYVDAATGRVTRETSRDGIRVRSFAFADFREAGGLERPFAWHLAGDGDPLDVVVESVTESAVAESDIAIPTSVTDVFRAPDDRVVRLPTEFVGKRILVNVTVDGHGTLFELDTGTTQLLIDGGAAARFALAQTLDHVIAKDVGVGPLRATGVPLETVGFGGFGGGTGLLGYEFFLGHVVHIDYGRGVVEIVPHDLFTAPPGATALAIDTSEGMPLVAGSIDGVAGDRFALDTGSKDIVVPRYFEEHRMDGRPLVMTDIGARRTIAYLEGPMDVQTGTVARVGIGPFHVNDAFVETERPSAGPTLPIPLDAIVGTSVLGNLDLWFDYDNARLYVRKL